MLVCTHKNYHKMCDKRPKIQKKSFNEQSHCWGEEVLIDIITYLKSLKYITLKFSGYTAIFTCKL